MITLTIGAYFGGTTVAQFGYPIAFVFNSLSFFVSAFCISRLRSPEGHFRADDLALNETKVVRPWQEYREGLRCMVSNPLILGIGLLSVGWLAAVVRLKCFLRCSANKCSGAVLPDLASSGVSLELVSFSAALSGIASAKRSASVLINGRFCSAFCCTVEHTLSSAKCRVGDGRSSSWAYRGLRSQ